MKPVNIYLKLHKHRRRAPILDRPPDQRLKPFEEPRWLSRVHLYVVKARNANAANEPMLKRKENKNMRQMIAKLADDDLYEWLNNADTNEIYRMVLDEMENRGIC